jgi:hypothetical protein
MDKTDLKRQRPDLYAPPAGRYVEVDVPRMRYLAVDGHGDPNTAPAYREAVESLFAAAYAAKFLSKRELERDYVVLPLEGLWWADDMTAFRTGDKASWSWRVLVRQPDWLPDDLLKTAVEQAHGKGRDPDHLLHLVDLAEGRCVQILHVGPYAAEGPALAYLHDRYLPEHGLRPAGLHHEIYLSDPRRVAPEKLRTILRQPVAAAAAPEVSAGAPEGPARED